MFVRCTACGKNISHRAPRCPFCGVENAARVATGSPAAVPTPPPAAARKRQGGRTVTGFCDHAAVADEAVAEFRGTGMTLDFSVASAATLDVLLDDRFGANGLAAAASVWKPEEDHRRLIAMVGSYIGEVVRARHGGHWMDDPDHPGKPLYVQLDLGQSGVIWPLERAYRRLKDGHKEALATYIDIVDQEVGRPLNAKEDAMSWASQASDFIKLGRADVAQRLLDRAIELAPQLSEAWFCRGLMSERAGRPADAQYAYEQALRFDETGDDAVRAHLQSKIDTLRQTVSEATPARAAVAAARPWNTAAFPPVERPLPAPGAREIDPGPDYERPSQQVDVVSTADISSLGPDATQSGMGYGGSQPGHSQPGHSQPGDSHLGSSRPGSARPGPSQSGVPQPGASSSGGSGFGRAGLGGATVPEVSAYEPTLTIGREGERILDPSLIGGDGGAIDEDALPVIDTSDLFVRQTGSEPTAEAESARPHLTLPEVGPDQATIPEQPLPEFTLPDPDLAEPQPGAHQAAGPFDPPTRPAPPVTDDVAPPSVDGLPRLSTGDLESVPMPPADAQPAGGDKPTTLSSMPPELFKRLQPNNEADDLSQDARQLAAMARFDEAIVCYEKAIESDMAPDEARLGLAVASLAMGQSDEALEALAPLVARRDRRAVLLYARCLSAERDHQGALRALDTIPDGEKHADVLRARADTLVSLGRTAEAMDVYRRSLVTDFDNPDAWFGLGTTAAAVGDAKRARLAFAAFIGLVHPSNEAAVLYARREMARLES